MKYFDTVFVYVFSCSALMLYGVGLERVFFEKSFNRAFLSRAFGTLAETLISVAALWFPVRLILVPHGLEDLTLPLVAVVGGAVSALSVAITRRPEKEPLGELAFYFGAVFLSLYFASSLVEALLIAFSSVISFVGATLFLRAIRDRTAAGSPPLDLRGTPLVLMSLGLLFLAMYAADASWWLGEVFP